LSRIQRTTVDTTAIEEGEKQKNSPDSWRYDKISDSRLAVDWLTYLYTVYINAQLLSN